MKERPILFSGPMVRAIFEGRKTQTRRVIKPQPEQYRHALKHESIRWRHNVDTPLVIAPDVLAGFCPYGAPGDRLWVRETWAAPLTVFGAINHLRIASGELIMYAADDAAPIEGYSKWKPSIHMPRSVSRITLEVTGVRVERVQDISEEDARAEGVYPFAFQPRRYFEDLWDSINAKRGYGWADNPWTWVVEFRRVRP